MNNRLTEFLLPDLGVRGALVEYESGVEAMLGSRPYPADVRKLLAQTVAAMPLLAAHTKLEGRLSLQLQHDEGAVQLLIAQIGRASCRGSVCKYVSSQVVAAS